eukprot:814233-Pleurochrysis_carterae.AAC.2
MLCPRRLCRRCRTVPDDILAKAIQGHLPKAVQRWDMHRQLAAQLGLHSLLCYTIGLRAQQPQSLVLSLSTGNLRLVDLDPVPLPSTEGNPRTAYGVPFRLTRNLQRVATPFGISGTFSAVFAAAAECLANTQKCPLAMWLDYLAVRRGRLADARVWKLACPFHAGAIGLTGHQTAHLELYQMLCSPVDVLSAQANNQSLGMSFLGTERLVVHSYACLSSSGDG